MPAAGMLHQDFVVTPPQGVQFLQPPELTSPPTIIVMYSVTHDQMYRLVQ